MQAPTFVSTLSARFSALTLGTTSRGLAPTTLRSFATAKTTEPSKKKSENATKPKPKPKKELLSFKVSELRYPIKRPPPPFLNFMRKQTFDTTMPATEKAKIAGNAWKQLSAEEKAKWVAPPEAFEEHRRKKEEWENSLSNEQRRARQHYLASKKSPVKSVQNGYALFLKHIAERMAQEVPPPPPGGQHRMITAAAEWKLLSPEQKQEFQEKANLANEHVAEAREAIKALPVVRKRIFTAKGPKYPDN